MSPEGQQDSLPGGQYGGPHDPLSPSGHPESFTKKSVILFIAAVVMTVLLVAGGTAFAIWSNQHQVTSASQQWCTTLDLLTRTPVPKPADPKSNPSRETAYELYADFMSLRQQFGCV